MATTPWTDAKYTITKDSYNDQWQKEAWEGPFDMNNGWKVYAASKVESERAAWKWVEEHKPSFEFNTVLPSANCGRTLDNGWQSTGSWFKLAADGDFSMIQYVQPQWFVNVEDDAKQHLAALIHPDIKSERVIGVSEPYTWNQALEILKEEYPDKKFSDGLPKLKSDAGTYEPRERSEWILREMGQQRYTTLRESLKKAFADY